MTTCDANYLSNEPMPSSLLFYRSYALHSTYQDMDKGGSNGCVNLRIDDVRRLWNILDTGDIVHIWGHKP